MTELYNVPWVWRTFFAESHGPRRTRLVSGIQKPSGLQNPPSPEGFVSPGEVFTLSRGGMHNHAPYPVPCCRRKHDHTIYLHHVRDALMKIETYLSNIDEQGFYAQ